MSKKASNQPPTSHRPAPPPAPPCRKVCAYCNYMAPTTEFKHICWAGIFTILMLSSLALIPMVFFGILLYEIF